MPAPDTNGQERPAAKSHVSLREQENRRNHPENGDDNNYQHLLFLLFSPSRPRRGVRCMR
jgi:hypothetical protein